MDHGLDTSFLVAAEIREHPKYDAARQKLAALVALGDRLAIPPQVLTEFIHVVTDGKRFVTPLGMDEARDLAQRWWNAREVVQIVAGPVAVAQFFDLHRRHLLGRKRLLDTMLAATFRSAGINSILTINSRDFILLGGFQCVEP